MTDDYLKFHDNPAKAIKDALLYGTGMWRAEYIAEQYKKNIQMREKLDAMPIKETKMTDFTKPVQTRSELPVTIISTEGRGKHSVIGYVGEQDCLTHWLSDGSYSHVSKHEHDLINVPEKRVMYVNVFSDDYSYSYATRKEADEDDYVGNSRIACIRIEYTEGQFDE